MGRVPFSGERVVAKSTGAAGDEDAYAAAADRLRPVTSLR